MKSLICPQSGDFMVKFLIMEFVKNNLSLLIGRYPILNAITLSGFLDTIGNKSHFLNLFQNKNAEKLHHLGWGNAQKMGKLFFQILLRNNFSLFTFHFSFFTFHFSLFTFHFSFFTFHLQCHLHSNII
jgi:hypothetical protein